MDPFVEMQKWKDFHLTFNTVVRERLSPLVGPRYTVHVEQRVYLEHCDLPGGEPVKWIEADAAITSSSAAGLTTSTETGTLLAEEPLELDLPMAEEVRETYLLVRERTSDQVVAIIETLSPKNKRPRSDGRREYLSKREEVLQSSAHLIEIDLLRGGERMPLLGPAPAGDYFFLISRSHRRPRATIYPRSIRRPLPVIPVPLLQEDPEARIDLQEVFTTVYDRARYDWSLNYEAELQPPLGAGDAAWMRELLLAKGIVRSA
jgi:hypothetical protein